MSIIKSIISGYKNQLKNSSKIVITTMKIVFFILFVLGISISIVYPLWYLADSSPETYSKFVGISILTLLSVYFIYKIFYIFRGIGISTFIRESFHPFLKKTVKVFMTILLLLITIYLFSRSLIWGISFGIVVLFIQGYFKFAKNN